MATTNTTTRALDAAYRASDAAAEDVGTDPSDDRVLFAAIQAFDAAGGPAGGLRALSDAIRAADDEAQRRGEPRPDVRVVDAALTAYTATRAEAVDRG